MNFSIIHPSRERCGRAREAVIHWLDNFSGENSLEYIISIDSDDQQRQCYIELCTEFNIQLIINNNRSLVDASNNGCELATGDCFVLVSDDFGCPLNWDKLLQSKIEKSGLETYGVLINDGITGVDTQIMSLPIISKTLFEKIGYIYHPDFFSLWADNALLDVVNLLNCKINATDLIFEHHHYSVGKSKKDHTYARENSSQAHKMGQATYHRLKARNYDL
jgi:glycosyltransferase involved in cell wall biosynthesis